MYSGESNSGHLSGMCSYKKPERSLWKGHDKPTIIRGAVGNKHVTHLKNDYKVSVDVEECRLFQTKIISYEIYLLRTSEKNIQHGWCVPLSIYMLWTTEYINGVDHRVSIWCGPQSIFMVCTTEYLHGVYHRVSYGVDHRVSTWCVP